MKKLLVILAVAAFFASCGSNESTETKVEEATAVVDSTVSAVVDSAKATIDSTAGAVVDSAKAKLEEVKK
jgi:PBP1b-binding outer membrane lipoprotein LpoB